ncbi:MAG: radical SAM protein, partial [Candidatus Binatia bacterium]
LLKHLLEQGRISLDDVEYNTKGAIVRARVPHETIDQAIEEGIAFMTNGCPDHKTGLVSCTRPFGSYRPSEPFRDYPFRPTVTDRRAVRRQLRLDRWVVDPKRRP